MEIGAAHRTPALGSSLPRRARDSSSPSEMRKILFLRFYNNAKRKPCEARPPGSRGGVSTPHARGCMCLLAATFVGFSSCWFLGHDPISSPNVRGHGVILHSLVNFRNVHVCHVPGHLCFHSV